jgi:hypothetical protein
MGQGSTFREDAARAKMVLFGTLANARLNADSASGTTDLLIEKDFKGDLAWNGDRPVIEVPRYVTFDPKRPPHLLVFCDLINQKPEPFRSEEVDLSVVSDYLKGGMALNASNRTRMLLYYFDFLDSKNELIAADAFTEFAHATDVEIAAVASKLPARKLRTWIEDPKMPLARLNLYAYLLGGCGGDAEAQLLRSLVEKPAKRTAPALGGFLSGYIRLRPREGWDLALAVIGNPRRPQTERLAAVTTLRFYYGLKPEENRKEVLRCLRAVLDQGDLADVAVEDLRRWQLWSLTDEVLAQYDKKSHSAPITRRAIIRYALCCPKEAAVRFRDELRKQDPDLVNDVAESLQFDKVK